MILNKEDFIGKEAFYFDEVKKGKIFVYPTDTIYGIGCEASSAGSVKKIREIKKRDSKPFSVIVPGKEWIEKNCVVPDFGKEWIEKLPGKFTLILKFKNKDVVARKELVQEADTIGVRIPDSWFAEFIARKDLVFVTTSVNFSGERPIANVESLPKEISEKVDYIIDDGPLEGNPSTLVNLSKEKVEIIGR